jgi:hypothetical protein
MARRSRAVRAVKTNAGFEGRGLIGGEKDRGWGGRLGPAFAVWDAACVVAGLEAPETQRAGRPCHSWGRIWEGCLPCEPKFLGEMFGFRSFLCLRFSRA